MQTRKNKLSYEEFFQERKKVLAQWPTGNEVDLDEAIEFHKSLPDSKVWAKKLLKAKQQGEIYAITGMGKTTIEQQIELLKYVQNEGQADLLATSPDSLTRVGNYTAVDQGIKESLQTGKSVLNGFPVINHGVTGTRKLVESVDLPVQMRGGGADARFLNEIILAAGHTSTSSGGGLYSFWNMNSKLPLEAILHNGQYTHRLVEYYEARGVPITLMCQGMYGCGIPPSLVMSALLVEVLLMAVDGIKHMGLHFTAQGNLVQDVASANTLQKLAEEYLNRYGFSDVETIMTVGISLAKYPVEIGPAFAMICFNSIVAKLCGAQINDMRTVSEAMTIPTKEDIAGSFRCAKVAINLCKGQRIEVDNKAIETEVEMVESETRIILDRVIDLGNGDVAIGAIRAVELGVLDNPFATSPYVACKVMGVKDAEGAVRYLNHGNIPFTNDILEFHKGKIAERAKKRGRAVDYETVISDLVSISRGYLVE